MNRRTLSLIAAILLVLFVGRVLTKNELPSDATKLGGIEAIDPLEDQTPQPPNEEAEAAAAAQASSTLTTAIPVEPSSEVNIPQEKPPRPVAAMIPPSESVKEEVKKDPHTTPRSIMKFSLELGDRFDKLKSDDEAREFMNELDACVNDGKNLESAQTLCLVSARDVAKKFKSLDAAYSNLESRADARVKKAAARMN